jgi:hypothetical protein
MNIPDQQRSAGEQHARGSIGETELGLVVELLTVTLGIGGPGAMRISGVEHAEVGNVDGMMAVVEGGGNDVAGSPRCRSPG